MSVNIKFTLKQARSYAGLNQTEAAEKLGISKPTMIKTERENGKRIKYELLLKMSKLYGIGINDLFIDSEG